MLISFMDAVLSIAPLWYPLITPKEYPHLPFTNILRKIVLDCLSLDLEEKKITELFFLPAYISSALPSKMDLPLLLEEIPELHLSPLIHCRNIMVCLKFFIRFSILKFNGCMFAEVN